MKLIFKPEDFRSGDYSEIEDGVHIVRDFVATERAQAKFDKWLDEQPVVYSHQTGHNWHTREYAAQSATHQARLVCIEEIKSKICEHEPNAIEVHAGILYAMENKCKHCGVKLKAKWEAE